MGSDPSEQGTLPSFGADDGEDHETGRVEAGVTADSAGDSEPADEGYISPTAIANTVKLGMCERAFAYEFNDYREEWRRDRDFAEAFDPLSPLLSHDGDTFEDKVTTELERLTDEHMDRAGGEDSARLAETRRWVLKTLPEMARRPAWDDGGSITSIEQLRLAGCIGTWNIAGDADVMLCFPTDDGLRIHIVDIKAAFEEKTHQQLQVAQYALLLKQMLVAAHADHPGTALDPEEITVTGGVLHHESEIDGRGPKAYPSFALSPREGDIRRLTAEDGALNRLSDTADEDTRREFRSRCQGCKNQEACRTEAVENESTALLGISTGAQRALAEQGITTVEQVAALADVPEDRTPHEYQLLSFARGSEDTLRALIANQAIGPDLSEVIQRAQTIAGDLAADADAFHLDDSRGMSWLVGAGSGSLPEDGSFPGYTPEIETDSLIRVYLHTHIDHRRDRMTVASAFITSTQYGEAGNDPIRISKMVPRIGDAHGEADRLEGEMLVAFFEDIFDGIREVAAETGHPDRTAMHFYTYSTYGINSLAEALARHDSSPLPAVRDLLGLRSALGEHHNDDEDVPIDRRFEQGSQAVTTEQSMISAIEPEIDNRFAARTSNTGLLAVIDQAGNFADDGSDFFWGTDGHYTRADGTDVNLRDAFRERFTGYSGKFQREPNGSLIKLPPETPSDEVDEWRPTRARHRIQIPTAYVWAALGQINESWFDEIEDGRARQLLRSYMYHSGEDGLRISEEDILALGETLAHALAHVERSIERRNISIEKRDLPLDMLESFSLDSGDNGSRIAEAGREVLRLEYEAGVEEARDGYTRPVRERVRSGESSYFIVTEVEERSGFLRVEGDLLYDRDPGLGDSGAERVASECKIKSGDRMVANQIRWGTDDVTHSAVSRPDEVKRGTAVTVTAIDTTDPPGTRTIELEAQTYTPSGRFTTRHLGATADASEANDEYKQFFQEGACFIIDPLADDYPASKRDEALATGDTNPVCSLLDDYREGRPVSAPRVATDAANESVERFCDRLDALGANPENKDVFPLNDEQRSFVTETDSRVSLLQGPPGTGKTSGALAPGLLARTVACDTDEAREADRNTPTPTRIAVSAASNTAVDELAADAASLAETIASNAEEGAIGARFEPENLHFVRLTGGNHERPHDRVDYVDLKAANSADDDGFGDLVTRLTVDTTTETREAGLSEFTDGVPTNLIVFGTPYRLWTLFDKLPPAVSAPHRVETQYAGEAEDTAESRLRAGERYFDFFGADEASMLRVPGLAAAGAFVRDDGQLLISGDHRQMPPVYKHEWDDELRRSTREVLPYLSSLDYFRLLRGEDVPVSDDAMTDYAGRRDADIPMTRLQRTYRCHRCLAGFLSKHVYERLDEIDYTSEETHRLTSPVGNALTNGQRATLSRDVPVSVVVYDDRLGRESNPTEVALVKAIESAIDRDQSVGVVTPHNAQKAWLRRVLNADEDANDESAAEADSNTLIETVERFQGGERDAIIISATASDPAFLREEEDFILSLNRLNVAMSRAKKKLVVVVSQSVFNLLPADIDTYNESLLWKALYVEANVQSDEAADWSGPLSNFVADVDTDPARGDVPMAVHSIPADHFD
jgi:uncharacterized protein